MCSIRRGNDIIDKKEVANYFIGKMTDMGLANSNHLNSTVKMMVEEINNYLYDADYGYFGKEEKFDIEGRWKEEMPKYPFMFNGYTKKKDQNIDKNVVVGEFLWRWFVDCFGMYGIHYLLQNGVAKYDE